VTTAFQLRFPANEIASWATRYDEDDEAVLAIVPAVKAKGFLAIDEFQTVCRWKTARSQSRCRKNSQGFVREVTQCALSTSAEQLRIEVLTLLTGVGWPTASVILHFFHSEAYPILDFRALWSLNADVPRQYDFQFWQGYTDFCRHLANDCGVSMRTLDRALWQFSNEKQR
jgi:hypothetical protein